MLLSLSYLVGMQIVGTIKDFYAFVNISLCAERSKFGLILHLNK